MSVIRSANWLRYAISCVSVIHVKLLLLHAVPYYPPDSGYSGSSCRNVGRTNVRAPAHRKPGIFNRPSTAAHGVVQGSCRTGQSLLCPGRLRGAQWVVGAPRVSHHPSMSSLRILQTPCVIYLWCWLSQFFRVLKFRPTLSCYIGGGIRWRRY